MGILKYDKQIGKWRKETKDEVLKKKDIENKHPCDKCWKRAREYGIYVFPLYPDALAKTKRCKKCGRVL